MKTKFSTIDLISSLAELQRLLHMRVNNVYDIDHKTYLFKLSRQEEKAVLLLESGSRIHTTEYEWPKNPAPSSFTMKLRKHIHNRRLEEIKQLGIDRIVDLQFGCNEAAYHVILELYDKGNIILTDYEYTILNILRPRTEGENVRFVVKEKYPIEQAKQPSPLITYERLTDILYSGNEGDTVKKILIPHLEYGPALIDHVMIGANFNENAKLGKGFNIEEDIPRLMLALEEAEKVLQSSSEGVSKGYIIQKEEKKAKKDTKEDEIYLVYQEFHPHLYHQHEKSNYIELPTFNKATDEYFSKIESQKLDMKAIQQEREALKKLENVKRDHEQRIGSLQKAQEEDRKKAELIEMNLDLVDRSILVVQSAIANQLDWKEISALIQEANQMNDPVAKAIKGLKLEINHISMLLSNPYDVVEDDNTAANGSKKGKKNQSKPVLIDIDLDLSAYANAKKYYEKKRFAAKKEQKTVESSTKAFKSAQKKTQQTLKEVAAIASINKARKTFWFEKFRWFISSENYLVIGGFDQQQNEMLVKRYLRPGDIYVHADLHGASSIVIKNPSGNAVPPKTLNEAGTLAVCSSAAWESKVVTSAWWVYHDQVSKTAPTGEYLTTGSFMVRGKKNYLPPCYLIMGFGFLFKLDEESIPKHVGERRVKTAEEDSASLASDTSSINLHEVEDEEISVDQSSDDDEADDESSQKGSLKPNETQGINEESSDQLKTEELTEDKNMSEEDDIDNEFNNDINDRNQIKDGNSLFPDTVIDLEHVKGDKFLMKPRTYFASSSAITDGSEEHLLSSKKAFKTQNKGKKAVKCEVDEQSDEVTSESEKKSSQSSINQQLKRGQKFKLKKMKEKYKDQDDDDRKLAMSILQSSGSQKETKKGKKGIKEKQGMTKKTLEQKGKVRQQLLKHQQNELNLEGKQSATPNEQSAKIKEIDDDQGSDEEKEAKQQAMEDAKLLDSLTGQPLPDDVLLFAVPVCAPYNSILNYKFKVKLTPGTGKRGKAAKTSLNMFMHDKTTTAREKDLFRSIKDQDVSRHLPGKVKLSAPQLLKQKHR